MRERPRMPDLPILFSAPMIRALLDGRKAQTRRILKPQPNYVFRSVVDGSVDSMQRIVGRDGFGLEERVTVPMPHTTGTRLWVRETHAIVPRTAYRMSEGVYQTLRPNDEHDAAIYRAGWDRSNPGRWRPSVHMPRWASRLALTVTDVRVQRLQDISEADAIAEGVGPLSPVPGRPDLLWVHGGGEKWAAPTYAFKTLWNTVNGPDAWDRNDWVAAYTFTVRKGNIDNG